MGLKDLIRIQRAGKVESRNIKLKNMEGNLDVSENDFKKYLRLSTKNAKAKMREKIDHERATKASATTKNVSKSYSNKTEFNGVKVEEMSAVKIGKSQKSTSKKPKKTKK